MSAARTLAPELIGDDQPDPKKSSGEFIYSLDYMRTIASWCVTFYHLGGAHLFGPMYLNIWDQHHLHRFNWRDVLNFHVLMVAVPVFVVTSSYLYARKLSKLVMADSSSQHLDVLQARLKNLVLLSVFWPFMHHFNAGSTAWAFGLLYKSLNAWLSGLFTIFYFFVVLLQATLLAHFLVLTYTPKRMIWGFVASVATVALLPVIAVRFQTDKYTTYWSFVNFLCLVFYAVWAARNPVKLQQKRLHIILGCIVLTFAFGVFEWNTYFNKIFFWPNGFAMPCYTRASIMFEAIGIITFCLTFSAPPSTFFSWFGKRGLGLYCLHWFVKEPVTTFLQTHMDQTATHVLSIPATILVSYVVADILKHFLNPALIQG